MPLGFVTDSYASAFLQPGFDTIFTRDATHAECWKQARTHKKIVRR